jgi:hypothetical protein
MSVMTTNTNDNEQLLNETLAAYDATLDHGVITRRGKPMPVSVSVRKNRLRFEGSDGNLRASGPVRAETIEKFVEGFWFWKKESR